MSVTSCHDQKLMKKIILNSPCNALNLLSRLPGFNRMGQKIFVLPSLVTYLVGCHQWPTTMTGRFGIMFWLPISTRLLYLSATGPGCSHLDDLHLASAVYFMEAGELYANVTCDYGYVIPGTDVDFVRIRCKGQTWSKAITECTGTKKVWSRQR